jgi:hypothetical protein
MLFAVPFLGEEVHRSVGAIALLNIPTELSALCWVNQYAQVMDNVLLFKRSDRRLINS